MRNWIALILVGWTGVTLAVNALAPGQLKKFEQGPPGTLPPPGKIPPGHLKLHGHPPPPPADPTPTPPLTGFGALIGGVTAQEKADWLSGRTQFQTAEEFSEGLGPIFNGQSCFQCHTAPDIAGKPSVGGASAVTETRFGNELTGIFDLLHQASTEPGVQDQIPPDSNVVAHRLVTPLFGIGLMESIMDQSIVANSQNGADGVFGRAAFLNSPVDILVTSLVNGSPNRVGRFGWKLQRASALAFAFDAQINEQGETNRGFGTDIAPHVPNGFALLVAAEPPGVTPTTLQDTPVNPALPEDPVTNKDDSDRYRDFMEFNAPPPPVTPLSASAAAGQDLFAAVGCVRCHTPSYTTGQVASASLSFRQVNLFSDLRLHAMGTLADGIPQAAALGTEMRTAPLWGLRGRPVFLHDGRASTVLEAIQAHDAPGAESQTIAQRFEALSPAAQQAILDFLNSI